jgi:ubiquinone/menaquinone biosynthesis C-methylase UbiE
LYATDRKAYKGAGMEGWVARWYTRTRGNDIEEFRGQARAVAAELRPGARVLEVAPGPGFFSIELAKLGEFAVTGLDISHTFVGIASANAQAAGVNAEFRVGNAAAMPLDDESVDFIYCSAAFKNFAEPVAALDEMHRVLRPGGQALVVDLRKDVSLSEVDAYLRQSGRSGFDAWLSSLVFRYMLVKRAYTEEGFTKLARQSRFDGCRIEFGPIGFEARFKKPEHGAAGAA